MFIRTITVSTNPATQMSLCYQSRETLDKSIAREVDDEVIVEDDFGTIFSYKKELFACESVIDNMQSNFVKANQKIDEINASQMFAEYLKENPALKNMLDAYETRQRMAQGQQMPQHGGKRRR